MDAKDALRMTMDTGLRVLNQYIEDFSDEELAEPPAPGCNPLAWQLGHLIVSETQLVNLIRPGQAAELPAGFVERHPRENPSGGGPYYSKQEYQRLFEQVRASTLKALEAVDESEFDAPAPERLRKRFPTVGSLFVLIGTHPLLHAGQFAVARRRLGKPVVI
jgi:hypothetical protein